MTVQSEVDIVRDSGAETDVSIVAVVSGRVDSTTSPQLDARLQDFAGEKKNIILDVNEVSYMSSAGIRALVSAFRTTSKHGRKVVLVHPSARVTEVLQLAGLTSIFDIYDNVGAATGILG